MKSENRLLIYEDCIFVTHQASLSIMHAMSIRAAPVA